MRAGQRGLQLAAALCLALACGGGGGGESGGTTSVAPQTFYEVSGEIRIAFASAVDGDVNDTSAPNTPNDTPATAQPLPAPVTLGGYVNVTGEGEVGRFLRDPNDPGPTLPGDTHDYFRVSLAAGQTVRLFIAADGANDDLDLALEDESGDLVDFSDTNTESEAVVAPAAGEYVIEVSAFSGASSYVLSIGQATSVASRPPEFVPGELIVRYRDGATSRGTRRAEAELAAADAAQLGLARVRGGASGPQLLAARDAAQLDTALRVAGKGHLSGRARARHAAASPLGRRERDAALRRDTRRLAKALRRRADVISADLNYVRRASAVPTDDYYPLQWHYPLVWLPEAWDLVEPDSGVVVAVIDTGVVGGHPDLQGQLVPGFDFITSAARANEPVPDGGCDADPTDEGDLALLNGRSSYHGTHVTGTVVASASLGGAGNEGVAGVAWNARVMPLRVLGVDGGTDFDLIQALRYAAGLSNACNALPSAPADVINLSLGGGDASATLDATLAEVRAAGLVVVAAAGNGSSSLPSYPAASPGVISVSAVDAQAQLARYSNFGSSIDLAAPGGDMGVDLTGDGYRDGVFSTLYDGEDFFYAFLQGTSMATPHVAGVVALMLGVNPDLTPTDIDSLLATGAMTRDIGSSTFFGRGLLDAFEAVSAAIEVEGGAVPALPPRLTANPGALNFGNQSTQASVNVSNTGGPTPPLSIGSFEAITDDGGAWLTLQAGSVDAAGLGSYTVRVARAGLADGVYTGAARFHSNAGDLDVPVIAQVGDAVTADADAGHHYVLLVDPDEISDTQYFLELDASAGRYLYRFSDVAPGRYYIYAGTTLDNDPRICERGDACGSYPTLDRPGILDVQGDMLDVDFLTGFGLRIGASSTRASQSGPSRLAPAPRRPVLAPAR